MKKLNFSKADFSQETPFTYEVFWDRKTTTGMAYIRPIGKDEYETVSLDVQLIAQLMLIGNDPNYEIKDPVLRSRLIAMLLHSQSSKY